VTSTADDIDDTGSLRYMIETADPGDTITFDLAYPAVIAISGSATPYPLLEIDKSLTIAGPGADKLTIAAYVEGFGHYDAFNVDQPGTPTADIVVSISGLTIENAGTAIWTSGYAAATNYQTHLEVSDVVSVNSIDGVDVDYGAIATIARTTISGADVAVDAYSDDTDPAPVVTISDSTLKDNFAAIYGSYASIKVINSTLSGNGSPDVSDFFAAVIGDVNSTTTLVFTTIAGSPGIVTPGIFALDASAVFNLKNSLIAGYSGGNCAAASPIVSLDYSISDDASCGLDGAHDVNDVPAGLSPAGLSWNSGPTQTIWLLPESPALNAIPPVNCTDDQDIAVTTDQRGATRPDAGACDVGAMESDRVFAAGME
jgi:hypothetical protein